MRFALQDEAVATTLVGMSKVHSVERNLESLGKAPDPELLAAVLDIIRPVANVVWKEGRPENDDTGAVEKQS
jgi:aryl-alcohol dehydrogenase-like predicted oxidoreductase